MERIKAFLWDRLGWITFFLGNSLLVMAWFSLWFVGEGLDFPKLRPVWVYGGGVTSFLVVGEKKLGVKNKKTRLPLFSETGGTLLKLSPIPAAKAEDDQGKHH